MHTNGQNAKNRTKLATPLQKTWNAKDIAGQSAYMLSRGNLTKVTMFAFSFLRALICINNNQGTTYCINNCQGTRYWGALMFIWHWSLGCFIHILWIYVQRTTNKYIIFYVKKSNVSRFAISIIHTKHIFLSQVQSFRQAYFAEIISGLFVIFFESWTYIC